MPAAFPEAFFHRGDRILVLPSRIPSVITSIHTFKEPLEEAFAPMSVSLTLADDIDISRGDMIVPVNNVPRESTTIEVMLCWMNQRPLQVNGKYAIKHTTRDARCVVREVRYILNINTLEKQEEEKSVKLNEIACVVLQTTQPLFYDPYSVNRITGSLILIDESTNETMGAGMIL